MVRINAGWSGANRFPGKYKELDYHIWLYRKEIANKTMKYHWFHYTGISHCKWQDSGTNALIDTDKELTFAIQFGTDRDRCNV